MQSGMLDLWNAVDKTIKDFTVNNESNAAILWHSDAVVSIIKGQFTNHVLRGSKTIVGVKSENDANELIKILKELLSQPDYLVKDRKTKNRRPFLLKIKTINCLENYGQIILSTTKIPVSQHNLTKDQVFKYIIHCFNTAISRLNRFSPQAQPNEVSLRLEHEKAKAAKLIRATLSETDRYIISYYKLFAQSYRIMYNDASACRKQTTIGDVIIAINGSDVIQNSRKTKRRTNSYAVRPAVLEFDDPFNYKLSVYREQ